MRLWFAPMLFAAVFTSFAQTNSHPIVGVWDWDKAPENRPTSFHFKADGTAVTRIVVNLQDGKGLQKAQLDETYTVDENGIVIHPRKLALVSSEHASETAIAKLNDALKALPVLRGQMTWSGIDHVRLELVSVAPDGARSNARVFELTRRKPVGSWPKKENSND